MKHIDKQVIRIMEVIPFNAFDDLRRGRADNAHQFNKNLRKLQRQLKEDNEADKTYLSFLCHLPTEEKSEPRKKQKYNDYPSERDDYCSDEEEEEENDPQYELFQKHLKAHDKSYIAEYDKDGFSMVIKYESDGVSAEACGSQPWRKSKRNMDLKNGLSNEMHGAENQHLHDRQSNPVKNMKGLTWRKSTDEVEKSDVANAECVSPRKKVKYNRSVYMHKGNTAGSGKMYAVNDRMKEKAREWSEETIQRYGVHNGITRGVERGRAVVNAKIERVNDQRKTSGVFKQRTGFSNDMSGAKDLHRHYSRYTSTRNIEDPNQIKSMNKIKKVGNVIRSTNEMVREYLCLHQIVKLEDGPHMQKGNRGVNEKIYGVYDPKKGNQGRLNGVVNRKVRFSDQKLDLDDQRKCDLRCTSINKAKTSLSLRKSRSDQAECSTRGYRKTKAANIYEKNHGKKVKYESESDVEILDSPACPMEGILSPFVPSTRLAEEDDELQHMESLKARNAFKKRVLDIIRKPFDKEEYDNLQQKVKEGRYRVYNPDLAQILAVHRYERKKRLTILRGFFFWLQHLTQEGAFKPWDDKACLVVEIE